MIESYLIPLEDKDSPVDAFLHVLIDTEDRLLTERHLERVTITRKFGDVDTDKLVENIHDELDLHGTGVLEESHVIVGLTVLKERS